MISFVADENFNGILLRGLKRRLPQLDVIRVQDTALLGKDDDDVLEWASTQRRIVLTHDLATLVDAAYRRVAQQQPMAGVFAIKANMPIRDALDRLHLLAECSLEGEWDNQVLFVNQF